ncbi:RhoGEF domain containing protein [Acanthamoeba castellanii str. Neff]|uniref:RhoGEF domain containing protein n=1 Tax=Acanthamoeba castellanii (strain ATCC 30010 / Neff) TaxID=1257118 RepID=L8GMV7_ACACF|nr:RhoGEF domain containing protein [Acanthamoeba castellanii str. Neff]ELR14078.1 RhoGEF domain containing protein [Acanthamoeba castellanii str. Neff]
MEHPTSSIVDDPPPRSPPSSTPSVVVAPPEEEAVIKTRPRASVCSVACWLFEPHEWKPAICRNCFSSLAAHKLDVKSAARDHPSALLKPGSRLSRRIRVPHYETFEFKLRENQQQEPQLLPPLFKSPRSPRSVPVVADVKLESEGVPAAAAASSPSLPVPVPETSSRTTITDEAGEAKGDGQSEMRSGKEEPQQGEGKVEADSEAGKQEQAEGDGGMEGESAEKKNEVDGVEALRPEEKAVGPDVGEEKGEVAPVAAERSAAAQAEGDDAPRRLREALAVIDKLRAKIARKNARLEEAEEEAEEVGSTLKSRMYDLLKEAAQTEKTQKQLMDEQAQARQREKEALEKLIEEQAQALQREKEAQEQLREEQAQAWQSEKQALDKLIEEQAQAWQREKEALEELMEERAQASAREVETQKRLMEEQAQAWRHEKAFWMQETSTVKRAFTLFRRQSMVAPFKSLHLAPPALPQEEAKPVTYDDQAVRACQSIVRSWLARRRGTRLITLVRAYSVSPHAKTQRRRFATIREFIQSERNYTEMLQHAIEHYMLSLRDKAEFEASTFSCEDVESLFNNMEMLAIISQQFLQALEQRFASTDKFTCYGDIILKFQTVLPLYSVYYRKYEETNEQLLRLSENEEFSQYVDELQKNSSYNPMLDLKVYLYRPCQRIPQYSMLLKQLLSYTPGEHVDYTNIMTAAERIQTILSLLNRRTEVEHSKRKMQELQNKVTGYDKNLADDRARRFVEEDAAPRYPGNTMKLADNSTKGPSLSAEVKTVPTSQQAGSLKVRPIRVFVLSDMLLFAKSLGNGTYRYKFSIPLGGAVVTEMQGFDNTLLIKAKGGADRFFLFKDAAERRKWTATLWPMILVLSADGRVKPDMRRKMNRGHHMRLTHIGMTNLMKVSLGQEPGETPELDHSLGRGDEETSSPASPTTTSRPPLPVVVLGGITTSAELPAEEVVEPRVLLSSQTKLLSPRSPRLAAVPTGAAAPSDPDVGKEDSSSNNNEVDEENEDGGGSSSARRGSSAGGEGRDGRRERRQSTVRRRDEEEQQQQREPSQRKRSRRDKQLPPLIRGSDRERDNKPSSPARPPTTRPPHPSAAWLEADHDGDRSRQRRAEESSSSASRRLSTSSIRSDASRASRPAKTTPSSKSAYHSLTGKTHHGSKEREKRPTASSRSQIVRGSGRPAGPCRSGEARDGSGGGGGGGGGGDGENGSRSSEVRATETLVRKRTRSNSFDEATIKRFVGAAKLENKSSGTPAGSALTKTTVTSSPRRRPLRRSTSANNPTPSDAASPRTDDDDEDLSRRRAERKSSTATDRRGSKAGLRV